MIYDIEKIETLNRTLMQVVDGQGGARQMIEAAGYLIPFTAAFCVVYQKGKHPYYVCDTYPDGRPKNAVQLYVTKTYLLNPIYNAIKNGLTPGLHRMADLAPDNWEKTSGAPKMLHDDDEEIGYRTPGWPADQQELALTVDLQGGDVGEISFSRPSADGGWSPEILAHIRPFYPVFAMTFRTYWLRQPGRSAANANQERNLEDFTRLIVSPREAEVVQPILKGHSSLSISLTLKIGLSTVKTHRKNAYVKLGISTQQQLFNSFLTWQAAQRP